MKSSSEVIADLKAERSEVSDRAWKLTKFIDSHAKDVSERQQSAMHWQLTAMNAYVTALDERIKDLEEQHED